MNSYDKVHKIRQMEYIQELEERVILVGAQKSEGENMEESLDELAELARTVKEAETVGPSEDTIAKLKDIYRFAVYIKCGDYEILTQIKDRIEQMRQEARDSRSRVQFDFDPL